ncbi:MAG: FmdB family zinc ribbon protein [Anaerolineales bacterium]
MPRYEYRCLDCKRRFEVYLSYDEYDKQKVSCTNCNSLDVQRQIGRIRIAHSEESRLEKLADPSNLAGLEDDPKALAKMMRQMGSELGEDMGSEYDEVLDRLESGQSPEEIESAMPDFEPGGGAMGSPGLPDL